MKRLALGKGLGITIILTIVVLFSFMNGKCMKQNNMKQEERELTLVSYNVENLFDTIDNPLTDDDEFLPSAERHWTKKRYYKKLHHIANVISRAGGELDFPAFVGLVEIENNEVLEDLTLHTDLANARYKYVISHSPDRRGIDVALLYRPDVFTELEHSEIEITFPSNLDKRSRNILHLFGKVFNEEPLHLFVCHAPSRREGARETQRYRNTVMKELKKACEQVYEEDAEAHIIIMGDFNAPPNEINHSKALNSKFFSRRYNNKHLKDKELILFNMMSEVPDDNAPGSYCYRGRWEQLDQFIISQSLLREESALQYLDNSVRNYAPRYLQRNRRISAGYRIPWRTYLGPHYIGGYSDHYPILMKLVVKGK